MPTLKTGKATLTRISYMPKTTNESEGFTLGKWEMDDKTWYTIEKEWKNNTPYVSCIPEDTYIMEKVNSPKYGPDMWEIMDVPNRTDILIHVANWAKNVLGCVGLGMSLSNNGVGSSKTAIDEFYEHAEQYDRIELTVTHFKP